jgi:hypothetical protein
MPGGNNGKRPGPHTEKDEYQPTLTLTAGNNGVCSTITWTIPTVIYNPTTTISTISTDVPSPYTSYVPVTIISTVAPASEVFSTTTLTQTATM